MTIWIRGWNNKWVRSLDNHSWILHFHIWFAYQRWWQLLLTPKHVILGAWYGYSSKEIYWFISRHIRENLQGINIYKKRISIK